ncbi:SBBP repeat-containing protein [Sinomonas mesophila]|uniref:DUF7948 domain-containing protein n=1 Tax=Sinomonas mesophila TaxID=1531955 RepID=UPI0009847C34|nr:SBBP repeat-containing protein [Sinomonas mesophila]
MALVTEYASAGVIGSGVGPVRAGRHRAGFTLVLIVLAMLAVASIVLAQMTLRVAGGPAPAAAGPVPAVQALGLPQPGIAGSDGLSRASREDALDAYGKLPLSFVANAGQTDESVRYYAQGAGFGFFFTEGKAVLSLAKGDRGHALELGFLGSSPDATLEAGEPAAGTVNYLTAGESHTSLPTYQQVVYRGLWPGIDMVFAGRDGTLKYEFHVAPGADPGDIRLSYGGADGLALGPAGALLIDTPLGALRDSAPTSYQLIDGRSVPVESRYALEDHSYGFALGGYDRSQPLVIDPALAYSTYLGGSGIDAGLSIAVDASGNAYVTGSTNSTDFPTTVGAFDTTINGDDAFVTKLSPTGSSLVYSTYLGGSGFDTGAGVAVDAVGSAYVTGTTDSADFPTTAGAFDTTFNSGNDAFVTKLNPAGSALVYSTYLGGTSFDNGFGIALDAAGSAYVTGETSSTDFPTTASAFDTIHNGGIRDAFVTKLDPTGSSLLYSTYLGGSDDDNGFGVAVDAAASAYVTGATGSTNFPTTAGAFDTTLDGGGDAFVTKLSPTGSSLVYSTYLGGGNFDPGNGVAVDATGSAHVTGSTTSTDFPTTAGAFDTTANGSNDAFVTKLSPTGSSLVYSTYLGGSGFDRGLGVAVDAAGNTYITGNTSSTDFPTTAGALDTTLNGGGDAFVTKLSPTGSSLLDSTYLGGSGFDNGAGVTVDAVGSAYVTGSTGSADFPTTAGAFDTIFDGVADAFVAKLTFGPGAPATITLAPKTDTNDIGTQHCVTATVKDASGNPIPGITVRFTVTGSVTTSGSDTTDANGEATFCYPGPQLPGADAITAFADTDNDTTQDPGEPSDTAAKAWTLPTTTPLCQVKTETGGTIIANNGDKATFGGNAQSNAVGNVKGQQQYQDHGPAQPQRVKSIRILALTCNPQHTQATIFGRATIDGQGSHLFRIDVQDFGEPGKGNDTYWIRLETGYDSGSHTLEGGNIQIR